MTWLLRAGILLTSAGVVYASVRAWKSRAENPSRAPQAAVPETSESSFEQSELAAIWPAGPQPEGMVWIKGGEFTMGCEDPRRLPHGGPDPMPDSRPIHRVSVDGFWMDRVEVTNKQYAAFVKATGYVTVAERTPRAEDYPGAPPENLVAGSVVFSPPQQAVPLDNHYQWWSYVEGASWRHPEGPKSSIEKQDDLPGHSDRFSRRRGLCEVGRQEASD